MKIPLSDDEIISALEWCKSSGIDEAIQDAPSDWFAWADRKNTAGTAPAADLDSGKTGSSGLLKTSPSKPLAGRPATPGNALPQAPNEAALAARESARKAQTLAELHDILQSFEGCGLAKTAKSLCFYRGAEHADIMLIGEAPGRDEDIQGKPFVGQAGQLLDKMLSAIDLTESDVHITNIIYWRPPGNRNPTTQEAEICRPFIERQIELVAPKILIFLGGSAAKQMLDTNEGIMRIRGKWREFKYADQTVQAIATLHPAYLLRTPAAKRLAWQDLLSIREVLNK